MSLFIVSALLGALNYITTVINLRTEGMTFFRMPLTIWAFFVTAILGVLAKHILKVYYSSAFFNSKGT